MDEWTFMQGETKGYSGFLRKGGSGWGITVEPQKSCGDNGPKVRVVAGNGGSFVFTPQEADKLAFALQQAAEAALGV